MSCSPGQTKVSAVRGRPWSGIPLFSEVLQFSIKGKQRSLTFSRNRIHFMLLIIRLILFSLTHLGLQLWQEKLASTPRARLKERWKGTLEEIKYDKSERQKHGWLREKRFGHNSLQIWYVYFKSRAPSIFISEVVVSVFLFSLREFVLSFYLSFRRIAVVPFHRFFVSICRFSSWTALDCKQ